MLIARIATILTLASCSSIQTSNPSPNPIPHDPHDKSVKTSQPVATFETTEPTRQLWRQQGKPVLLSGNATRYPVGVNAELGGGWVQMQIEVLANGKVGTIVILDSADQHFHAVALEAIRSWKFEPSSSATQLIHRLIIPGTRADHYQPSSDFQ